MTSFYLKNILSSLAWHTFIQNNETWAPNTSFCFDELVDFGKIVIFCINLKARTATRDCQAPKPLLVRACLKT